MKSTILAVAAAMATGVSARQNARGHAHQAFHVERNYLNTASAPEPSCGCVTVYTTITGEPTLYTPAPAVTYKPSTVVVVVAPTPLATTCPTPGVYTIPAKTITLEKTTTVCGATSTTIAPGTHTAGGVTTVVKHATTVVCPYAAVSTHEGVVTSTILTTTYVCPSAGTYTIAPLTTTASASTVWVYPTPVSYAPGTYTQKEVVTTVTATNYVVYCPYTSATATAHIAAPPAKETYPAVAPPKATYSASPPPKAPAGQLGNSGKQWAITYTPYTPGGQCKTASEVNTDIALIASKGFLAVRVYSTDCSALPHIGSACEANKIKMILGVFINDTGCSGATQQVTDIATWAKWGLVELILIGNEAIFSGHATASELASFINTSKATLKAAGYTGPCSTAEPLNIWQEAAGALCGVVDVVGANIHPFFNTEVTAETAGAFALSQLKIVETICPGKPGYNLETGWPSAGVCNGAACPGKAEQATAIHGIAAAVGGKSCILSFGDDDWKNPGAFSCEQHWGAIQLY